MSLYKFGIKSSDNLMIQIDNKTIYENLLEYYDVDEYQIEAKIKKVLKNEQELNELASKLQFDIKEMITILLQIFPDLFNCYMIKFIKKTYLGHHE